MKKCRHCTKSATLHITEIQNGDVQELHLCESCAQQYLQNPEPTFDDSAEDVSLKLSQVTSDEELEELDHVTCPNCGITFKEFRQKGRLGCPHDYTLFAAELTPLLESIHGDDQHCGKCPKRAPGASQRQYQLIKLRSQLRMAVEDEDYEQAAQLRDEIQTLETELSNNPPESDG